MAFSIDVNRSMTSLRENDLDSMPERDIIAGHLVELLVDFNEGALNLPEEMRQDQAEDLLLGWATANTHHGMRRTRSLTAAAIPAEIS